MKRLLHLFHKEFTSVREAALLLAVATVASSALGLVRDRLLASRFGAGVELDVYYAAFRIPDILYAISLFFVASTAVIPLFLDRLSQGEHEAQAFVRTLFAAFLISISGVVVVAYITMPFFIPFLVPGFGAETQTEVVHLSRLMLLSPVLLGLSNLVSSILQSFRRFFVYAASFLFYNLGIIFGILFLVPRWGLIGLAAGVVIGALLHVGIQIPTLLRTGYVPRISFEHSRTVIDVFRRSFPRTLGLAANQITFFAVTAAASLVGAGSIAVFQLSYNLQSLPLSVIGLSYSIAAFPTMAELMVKKERAMFFEHLISAFRQIIFWTLPAAVLFLVLRAQIVRSVLGAGAFGWVDTRLTAASLALFSLGIVAQSVSALFVRAAYAAGNVRLPVIINICSALVTVFLAFLFVDIFTAGGSGTLWFMDLLRVRDVPHNALLGLPLAFALGALANALALMVGIGKMIGKFSYSSFGLGRSFVDIVGANILLGVVTYSALQIFAPLFDLARFWGIFLQGAGAGSMGILVAALFLYLRGNKEFQEVWEAGQHKFWKRATIGPEQEHL